MNDSRIIDEISERVSKHSDIGIFCSGGFDSTLLCYILFSILYRHGSDSKVTVYTVPRTDDSLIHAERILEWIVSEFPTVDHKMKTVGKPDLHHSLQVRSGIIDSWSDNCTILLLGDTALPPGELGKSGPIRIVAQNPRVYQPFIAYDKTITVELANAIGMLNEISEISHTCTESVMLRCKKCWQCQERAWAFEKLKLVDPGTM